MRKGFAITGIIYGMFLLFVVVLMGNLSTQILIRKNADASSLVINNKVKKAEYAESGVNAPLWKNKGLIPITRNAADTAWIVADTTSSWYNYATKKWANAVVVNDTVRGSYVKSDGSVYANKVVNEADVLGYFVWIPRYKYAIPAGSGARQIAVVFESGTAKTGTSVVSPSAQTLATLQANTSHADYITHSAFTFGAGNEITGFWVGKFETGGTLTAACTTESCNTSGMVIKPNTTSLKNYSLNNFYFTARSMQRTLNEYGLTSVNTRVMKNTEWGAVAYLTTSSYGKNTSEVWKNPNSNYITGCAGASVSAVATTACDAYNTTNGLQASTTGNIYGIYDMSGGSYEMVMGGMKVSGNATMTLASTSFAAGIADGASYAQYFDKYNYGTTYNDVTAYNRRILGDATQETLNWNTDLGYFVYHNVTTPNEWFLRGGYHGDADATVGIFKFYHQRGQARIYDSFRVTMSM